MPIRYFFKSAFEKAYNKLPTKDRLLAVKALEALDTYFRTGKAPYGLRIKKLYEGGSQKTSEARVSLDLRIVWVKTEEEISFALLGNHDDVRRFIRNL